MPLELPIQIALQLGSYEGVSAKARREVVPAGNGEWAVELGAARWRLSFTVRQAGEGTVDLIGGFRIESGEEPCGRGRSRTTSSCPRPCTPGTASGPTPRYPPFLRAEEGAAPLMPVTITDVPRLGLYSRRASTAWGLTGLRVDESPDRTVLHVAIEAPAVRERSYRMAQTDAPSEDRGARLCPGDRVSLRVCLKSFAYPDVPALFDALFASRKELTGAGELVHCFPLSAAFRIIEDKYNRSQWNEAGCYCRVGPGESRHEDRQAGWVGGGTCSSCARSSLPCPRPGSQGCGASRTPCSECGSGTAGSGSSWTRRAARSWPAELPRAPSPLSLVKLYRVTLDRRYLDLGREISHNITQYLSRADRPIESWDGRVLPPGWMCERVNTSDWEGEGAVGGVFYGSCWCELACLLTWTEVPAGVWLWSDAGGVVCFDHVDATVADRGEEWVLGLSNPTDFDAERTVLGEERSDVDGPLGECALVGRPRVRVPARGRAELRQRKARW